MISFAAKANECYREGITWSNQVYNGTNDIIDTFHLDLRRCTQAEYFLSRTVRPSICNLIAYWLVWAEIKCMLFCPNCDHKPEQQSR